MTSSYFEEPKPDCNIVIEVDGVAPFEANCRFRKHEADIVRLFGKKLFSFPMTYWVKGTYIEYVRMPRARLSIGNSCKGVFLSGILRSGSLAATLTSEGCKEIVERLSEEDVDRLGLWDLAPKSNEEFYSEQWAQERLDEFYSMYTREEIRAEISLQDEEKSLKNDCDVENAKYIPLGSKVITNSGAELSVDDLKNCKLPVPIREMVHSMDLKKIATLPAFLLRIL